MRYLLVALSIACLALASGPRGWTEENPALPLSLPLEDASREAVVNNPTAREARLQWLISQSRERSTWGDFEPSLVSSVTESGQHRLNNAANRVSQLGDQEYKERKAEYDVGLEGKFLSGADYRLGYSLSKTESSLIIGSEYETFLGLSLTQPLLKGAVQQAPLSAIRLGRLDTQIAFHTYRKQLMAVVSGVEDAYWDLVLAQELTRVAEDSVRMAAGLLEDSRQRLALGKLSELDLSEADTQLRLRAAELEGRRLDAVESAARLRLLMAGELAGAPGPLSAADPLAPEEWDPEKFLADAAALPAQASLLQPDVAIRRVNMEKSRIQLNTQRDQHLPELNARASYGFQGLGDDPHSALDRLQSQGFPSWSLSLEFHLPVLGDIKGGSAVEEAALGDKVAAGNLQAVERETTMTVEALVQRVLTYGKNAENTRAVSGFRKQLLDVELQRFEAGKSDIRRIYDLEQGFADARQKELESYNRFRKSMIDLASSSGTTLLNTGLEKLDSGRILLAGALLSDK
jgi:outer membrane protein TolC